jgi:hypothetical protein
MEILGEAEWGGTGAVSPHQRFGYRGTAETTEKELDKQFQ